MPFDPSLPAAGLPATFGAWLLPHLVQLRPSPHPVYSPGSGQQYPPLPNIRSHTGRTRKTTCGDYVKYHRLRTIRDAQWVVAPTQPLVYICAALKSLERRLKEMAIFTPRRSGPAAGSQGARVVRSATVLLITWLTVFCPL